MSLVDDYLRLRLGQPRGRVSPDHPDLDDLLTRLQDAEHTACASLGRLPPAQLPGRLAFARTLDWTLLTQRVATGPIRLIATGPGRAIADIAALFLPEPPTSDPTAPVFAFLQGGEEPDELLDLRKRCIPVLAPWTELPACPPQDVASDLLPHLVAFCGAVRKARGVVRPHAARDAPGLPTPPTPSPAAGPGPSSPPRGGRWRGSPPHRSADRTRSRRPPCRPRPCAAL